jgi:hypothetical protein
MAHALIHVLGSRAGYTTLDATPGVSTGERAELEILSFGDATNAEAMSRLETSASMIGRRLRSGRFAISRMLPGGTDDAGRPTIEVISLIVDSAAYAAVVGAIHRLAADVRFWRLARASVSRGYALPEESVRAAPNDPQVLRAYDGWVAARRQGGTAVLGDADAAGLFAMVALLDAQDLGECRWGVGVLSLSAPVDVCTLAPTAASIGPRPVLRVAPGAAWLNREMEFASLHAARNRLLPPSAALATAVRIEPGLDRSASAVPVGEPDGRRSEFSRRPRNLTHIAGVTAAASFALLGVMVVVYARGGGGARTDAPLALETTPPVGGDAATMPGGGAYDGIPTIPPVETAASGVSPAAGSTDVVDVSDSGTDLSTPSQVPTAAGDSGSGAATSPRSDPSDPPPAEPPQAPGATKVDVPASPPTPKRSSDAADPISVAIARLKKTHDLVCDVKLNITSMLVPLESEDLRDPLIIFMQELKDYEDELRDLCKSLHESSLDRPHRIPMSFWRSRCVDECKYHEEMQLHWERLLSQFKEIDTLLEVDRRRRSQALEHLIKDLPPGVREAQRAGLASIFVSARAKGPKYLLDTRRLQKELDALEERKPTEAKP